MSFLDSLGNPETPGTTQCARKGCRRAAQWSIRWNNPKVHTADRLKVWLACDEHRAWLEDYLSVRGFFRDTVRFQPEVAS